MLKLIQSGLSVRLLQVAVVFGGIFPVMAQPRETIGWLENVYLSDARLTVKAKIDTGADVSSIDAKNIKIIQRDGEEWVTFEIENNEGSSQRLTKRIVRYALIKRKRADPVERPVVMMNLCIGNQKAETEVNLANRSNYTYRMLIGRSFLKKRFVVDSALRFSTEPSCSF